MFPKQLSDTEALPTDQEEASDTGTSPMLSGSHNSVIMQNVSELKNRGVNEREAHRLSMAHAKGGHKPHKNLGKFLHKRKDGKPHGSDRNPPEMG